MKSKSVLAFLVAITAVTLVGCSHKEQATTTQGSSEATSAAASSGTPSAADKPFVTFDFKSVAVATTKAPTLRLTFAVKNGGTDPLLCDESEFSVELSDGTKLPVDAGAENTCIPDSIDPGSSATAVMFFDLKAPYAGPVTVVMTSSQNNAIVGRGTAQVH